jgi:hypothetical protein
VRSVLPLMTAGRIEASATRRPSIPSGRSSSGGPMPELVGPRGVVDRRIGILAAGLER